MLKNIPKILPPELLAALSEMGHSDRIVLADANFPGRSIAGSGHARFIRMDGIGIPALLEAVLRLMPLDGYVETPVQLMQKMECDRGKDIPIWEDYIRIVEEQASLGRSAVAFIDRFAFYREAERAACIVQTGELSTYANVMLQKGVVL